MNRVFIIFALALTLIACGGGGGSTLVQETLNSDRTSPIVVGPEGNCGGSNFFLDNHLGIHIAFNLHCRFIYGLYKMNAEDQA